MIDDKLGVVSTKDVSLPAGYHDVVREAKSVRSALATHPAPLTACHCDPLCENFLDTGERMWIVDWEYSGMNDPSSGTPPDPGGVANPLVPNVDYYGQPYPRRFVFQLRGGW
jgi:hypothetical protein